MAEVMQERTGKELFEAHFEALKSRLPDEAAWVGALRCDAMERFSQLDLPTVRQEMWRHTNVDPLRKIAFRDESAAIDDATIAAAVRKFDIAELNAYLAVFVNGRFAPAHSRLNDLPQGVEVGALSQAIATQAGRIERYLGNIAGYREHAFVALNTALFEDGGFVSVDKGIALERPIHLLFLNGGTPEAASWHPRNLLLVSPGAQATVIESYAGIDESVYLTNAVTEVALGDGANLDHYKLQRESRAAFHFQTLDLLQQGQSVFDTHALTQGCRLGRNDINARIDGEGCDTIFNGLYMLTDQQLFDTHTLLDHARPHCHSREMYKGILNGQSRAIFRGKIMVRPHAQKTDAVQSSKNLLLSSEAQVNAQPQLEIYADDVKCTHGATIGQVNEDASFYLRSRGLSERQANALLMFAFANDNLNEVKNQALRTHLERLIHDWLDQYGGLEAEA